MTNPFRRTALSYVLLPLLAAGLAACGPGPGQTTTPEASTPVAPVATTVGLTYIPNIQFAAFYVADKQGLYPAPAQVTMRHHGAMEGLFTALTTGDEQFVVAGGDEILQARSQGIDIVAVAAYYAKYPARIIVPENSAIKTVADLKGHSIGLPGRFGENWFALLIALDQAGLTENDVNITEIGFTQQAALSTGKVDSVVGFSNSDVLGYATINYPVRVIDPQAPLVSICLATTGAYARDNPAVVRAVIAGMKQGMAFALNDPAATLEISAGYIPSFRGDTLETAKKVLPATTALFTGPNGEVSPPLDGPAWTAMGEAMAKVKLIPAGTDAAAAYTNEFQTG